jgi:hypothetical protein
MSGTTSGAVASLAAGARLAAGIDVIVRFHDPARMDELDRALFSLVNQSFRPVHPVIVAQNLSEPDLARLRQIVELHDWDYEQLAPTICNVAGGGDLRSKLLNVGISLCRHRYLAILDFDDYLYGHAYAHLISAAIRHGAAISFGDIVVNSLRIFDGHAYVLEKTREQFRGASFDQLLSGHSHPIHSFVVDRSLVDPADLRFDEALTRLEDYEFLLRLAQRYPMTFDGLDMPIGVYNWRVEGGNSTDFFPGTAGDRINKAEWAKAQRRIWRLKCTIRSERFSARAVPNPGLADTIEI